MPDRTFKVVHPNDPDAAPVATGTQHTDGSCTIQDANGAVTTTPSIEAATEGLAWFELEVVWDD